MALSGITQARDLIQAAVARAGYSQDLDALLRGLVDGDLSFDQQLAQARTRSEFFDDFLAAAIDGRISSTAGSGTGNAAATTVAGALNGQVTLKSASDDGAHGANFSTMTFDQLNYKASQGRLVAEARFKIDDVSEAFFFMGFTDTISTTVEGPIFMNGADIDSDATDAAGLLWDVDATTDVVYVGGVKNGTDTAPVSSAKVLADNTWYTFRVEIDTNGTVFGFIDGVAVGSVANAITTSVAITPAIFIGNRSANQVTLTLDYWAVAGAR